MYADQTMDNLARAYDNEPFVQLEYKDILNDDTDTYTGTGKVTETLLATTPFAQAGFAAFTRDLADFWSIGGSGDRKRQMQFMANPITQQNDIYVAYLQFARDPCLLRKTADRPAPAVAHTVYKKNGWYYWVPAEAREMYLALALRTSVMREANTAIESFYERTIVTVDNIEKFEGEGFSADINFAKDKTVPNGSGTMVVPLENGQKVRLRVLTSEKELTPEGSPVTRLSVQVRKGVPLTVENLRGAKVRFYSDFYPPETPTQLVDLNPVLRGLERVRQADSFRPLP